MITSPPAGTKNISSLAADGNNSRASGRNTAQALPRLGPFHGLNVEGSNPFARSIFLSAARRRRTQ